jgi:hypothetical protein
MACGKCNGFVEEKQLCVSAWRHHGAPPIFEFQETSYPPPTGVLTHNFAILIVQHAAPIAHERATRGKGHNRSTGVHAVS